MPDVVSAVVATVKAIGFFLKTTAVIHQSINLLTIAKLALTAGAAAYQRNKAKKALRGLATLDSGRTMTVKEPAGVRQLIYGQMRVGGTLVFASSSGTNKEYLHLVIVHASHECEEIGDCYLNDEVVPVDASGNATGKYAGYVRIKKHLGTDAQTVDTDLQTDVGVGVWSNDHRLRGICYSYVRLKHNPDLFPSGVPNFSAVIKGRKVYDPRTATTAWSANVALCLRDYLLLSQDRGGLGADSSEVDDTAVTTAANICDESVTLADGVSTETRYTANGVVSTSSEPGEVIASLCGAMAGICPYVGGVFKMKAGAHTASVATITEDDVRGNVSFSTRDSLRDAFNGVKGTYVSSKTDYQLADFPPVVNATYTTEDGGQRLWRDIALNFTTSSGMAQRLAKIELERGRQDIVVNLRTSLKPIEAHVGDVVSLTLARYGWSAKLFEVVDLAFHVEEGDGGPVLGLQWTLRETASGVWDWAFGEETTVDLAPNTTLVDPFTVATPGGLSAVSNASTTIVQEDGTVVPRVLLSWTAATDESVTKSGRAVVEYKTSASGTWLEWGTFAGSVTQVYLPSLPIGVNHDFRVKWKNANGVSGAYATVTGHTVAGDAAAPAAPTGLAAAVGTGKVVSLDWADSTEADLGEYGVYRNTVNDAGTATKIAEVRASRFVDADVALGTTYYYWVTAIDRSENESAKSSGVSATPSVVGSGSVDMTAPVTPSAPTFVSETTYQAGDGAVFARVTVAAPALPSGAVANDVLYRRSGGSDWIIGAQMTAAGNVSIDDLSPGVAYEFAVRAVSFSGALSAVSTALSRTAPGDTTAPGTPTGLAASAGTGKAVSLGWTANTEADLAGYKVYRNTVNNAGTATLIGRVTASAFVDASASEQTTYWYFVSAYDTSGNESAKTAGVSTGTGTYQRVLGDVGGATTVNGTTPQLVTALQLTVTSPGGQRVAVFQAEVSNASGGSNDLTFGVYCNGVLVEEIAAEPTAAGETVWRTIHAVHTPSAGSNNYAVYAHGSAALDIACAGVLSVH